MQRAIVACVTNSSEGLLVRSMSSPMLVKIEEDRHWWFASRTRAITGLLDRYLEPDPGRLVLDVGCGAGNMAHHLALYGKVIGVDPNPKPLEVARQRRLRVYESSADSLPFGDSTFGLIALLDTVEHVPNEQGVFAECYRVLKPGGFLIVTVPAFMWLWSQNDELNAHQRRYTVPELQQRLAVHGFHIEHTSYNNFFVFPLAAGRILLRRGRAEPQLASPHFDEEAYQVEMEPASPLINRALEQVGAMEASLMQRVSLPVGTSIICLARR